MQSPEAVSAHFTSKQILPFGFAEQYSQVLVLLYRNNCLLFTTLFPTPPLYDDRFQSRFGVHRVALKCIIFKDSLEIKQFLLKEALCLLPLRGMHGNCSSWSSGSQQCVPTLRTCVRIPRLHTGGGDDSRRWANVALWWPGAVPGLVLSIWPPWETFNHRKASAALDNVIYGRFSRISTSSFQNMALSRTLYR